MSNSLDASSSFKGSHSRNGYNDTLSAYSGRKSVRGNQKEVVIDIHVKHLRLKVQEKTVVRVVWSRGKKSAKTHSKTLSATLDKAIFDEKFQINTILELDQETGYPALEKIGKMTVCLDKSMGGTELCEVSFNMADFKFDEYKVVRLHLNQCPANNIIEIDRDETFLDIGLKGKRANGLLQASLQKQKTALPPLSKSTTSVGLS